jgi:hypothetical protein
MKNSKTKEFIKYLLSENHLMDSSQQYLASVLKEYGYNYHQLKAEGNEVAAKLFLKLQAQAAKQKLLSTVNDAKSKLKKLKTTEERTLQKIQELFEKKYASKYTLNFRDLKKMNEEDALSILADLEILEFLDQHNIKDAKPE